MLSFGFAEAKIFDEPIFDAKSSLQTRLRARLFFLKKHSKIIKRAVIGNGLSLKASIELLEVLYLSSVPNEIYTFGSMN